MARPARQPRQPARALPDRAPGPAACWSPFANEAGNYNVAVTGKSGSGKSVLMQELVTGLIGAGGEAVVIDDGRSFQHTAEALEGAFIAFGKDPACLNPFAMIDAGTAKHDGDYREECFAMLAGVIGRMARRRGSIDDIEAALIAEAIAAAWDEAGNDADLGTVRENLEARDDRRAADMATSLGPWCPGGAMGRLFAGSNVPDLENAMTVFELAELKGRGDVQAVVLMLVVFLATQRMYHGPRTKAKAIVIDEAWDLLSGEDSKSFLEGAARRARKYRGALVTGTQSVNDYYANPAARAAWENSDWVIFLAQKDESVELLKSEKRIHCDPGMERALKSLTTADGRYAELVLHGPDGWRVARLVLDAWSVALFSSRGPAFAAVERLKAEGLSTVEAIDRLAGDAPPPGRGPFGGGRSPAPPDIPNHRKRRTRHDAESKRRRRTAQLAGRPGEPDRRRHRLHRARPCAGQHLPPGRLRPALPLGRGAGRDRVGRDRGARRAGGRRSPEAGAPRADRGCAVGLAPGTRAGLPTRGRTSWEDRRRHRVGRARGRGLDAVLDEEPAELLRFVTRMATATERRDLLEGQGSAGAGVAFPPLKRRIRSIPPDKAAEAWLARFRALAGPEEERRRHSTADAGSDRPDADQD